MEAANNTSTRSTFITVIYCIITTLLLQRLLLFQLLVNGNMLILLLLTFTTAITINATTSNTKTTAGRNCNILGIVWCVKLKLKVLVLGGGVLN